MKRARKRRGASAITVVALSCAGCGGSSSPLDVPDDDDAAAPAGPPWFEEVAAERGIDFTWVSGHQDRYYMPEITGGGAALFDMDGDGDLDAYLVQGGGITREASSRRPNRLFENLGDGAFRDVTEGSGADHRGYGMGAACGDYDHDGDVDLYVTNVGPDALLRNEGGGRFTDVTEAAGVGNPDWGSSAAFFDYDLDGDLDLFVLTYVNWSVETEITCYDDSGVPDYCLPANYGAPGRDALYRNDGDGKFTDVTVEAGMIGAIGTGLGLVCGDLNGDRWPDVFVANDGMPDQLWFNRRDGTFIEFGTTVGTALDQEGKAKAGMGVTAADIDDDGDLDVLVCNLWAESDSLFLNEGQYFRDSTIASGLGALTRRYTRFGIGWLDFDNDGYLDLYEANGRVQHQSLRFGDDVYAEPNMLMRGSAGPKFQEVRPRGGTRALLVHTSRAAAFGDVDNDGGIDILVVNRDGPAYLLRNIVAERGHWLTLRLIDANGRDAIGALVRVRIGERELQREARAAYSYLASNDPRVHIGLGELDRIDVVSVLWPDGRVERFSGIEVDRVNTLRSGEGQLVTPRSP